MNTQADFRHELPVAQGAVDRLLLGNYIRQAEIGAFDEERGVEQSLRFNLTVEITPTAAIAGDDVDGILSYATLVQTIAAVLEEERLDLLETLADRIADRLLALTPVRHVQLKIEKLDRGPFALGIEIERANPSGAASVPDRSATRAPAPMVVMVPEALAGEARLQDWFDALLSQGRPVVLVASAEAVAMRAATRASQRQVDLLAMEQAAWRIAGRDARCRVVESRTELQYAIDQAFLAVWAPGRIVRRAPDPSVRDTLRGEALADWFARHLGAAGAHVMGPDGALTPVGEPAL